MCQSCGNPWSLGNYKMKIQKTYKASTIKKIKRRISKSSTGGCDLQKNMIKRYSKCPSTQLIQCLVCKKSTSISIPLPPRIEKKTIKADPQPELPSIPKKQNEPKKKKKKVKQNTAGLKIPNVSTPNLNNNTNTNSSVKKPPQIQSNSNSNSNAISKKPNKKSTFSKAQMKLISQSLNKGQPQSSLQAFLNSVK